jgi:hypothetical protein
MLPMLFVTTFSKEGYVEYGKRFLQSFIEHFPKNAQIAVITDEVIEEASDPRIMLLSQDEDWELSLLLHENAYRPYRRGISPDGKYNFRFDAMRFAPKVFAISNPMLPDSEWRIWIDSDVFATKGIPEDWFQWLLQPAEDCVAAYLGRPKQVASSSECGFVAYRTADAAGRQFLQDFRANYRSWDAFRLGETHDSFVFDVLRMCYEQQGAKFFDLALPYYNGIVPATLNFNDHGNPWPHTLLAQYLVHEKGPAKKIETIKASLDRVPEMNLARLMEVDGIRNRYDQIYRMLRMVPHKNIVEVGFGTGDRAVAMCLVNLEEGLPVDYTGFDLFEDLTPEVAAAEMNGKRVATLKDANDLLEGLSNAFPGKFTYRLVKGNTNDTLMESNLPERVDFAFIDGGHSVETIEHDFAILSNASVLMLDDYYTAGFDTERFGCNKLFEKLGKMALLVLPKEDVFGPACSEKRIRMLLGGQRITSEAPKVCSKSPKIKTRNCVSNEQIIENITYTSQFTEPGRKVLAGEGAELVDTDFRVTLIQEPYDCSDMRVVLVGGSGTVTDPEDARYKESWEHIRMRQAAGWKIIVAKTSYKSALANDVIPWACTMLDPRDHVAANIEPVDPRVKFICASMCHKSTWDHLRAVPGVKAYVYHASVGAGEGPTVVKYFDGNYAINGGTTSIMRTVFMTQLMNFGEVETIGIESSYPSRPKKHHGRTAKPCIKVETGGRRFWTDPELIAQSQDVEQFTRMFPHARIKFLGDGLLQEARKQTYLAEPQGEACLDFKYWDERLGITMEALRHNDRLTELQALPGTIEYLEKRLAALKEWTVTHPTKSLSEVMTDE